MQPVSSPPRYKVADDRMLDAARRLFAAEGFTRTLTGGNLGPLHFASFSQSWGATAASARSDAIDLSETNVQSAAIDVRRARVDCHVARRAVKLDGPLTAHLPGCRRSVHLG